MRQYGKIMIRGMLGLLAVTVMAGVVQVQAAAMETRNGVEVNSVFSQTELAVRGPQAGEYLLAQTTEHRAVKPVPPPTSPAEPKKLRKRAAPPPAMERTGSKSMEMGDDLERAGTRKLGGQTIRAKED
jgi:hypothetical protein